MDDIQKMFSMPYVPFIHLPSAAAWEAKAEADAEADAEAWEADTEGSGSSSGCQTWDVAARPLDCSLDDQLGLDWFKGKFEGNPSIFPINMNKYGVFRFRFSRKPIH